MNTMQNNIIKEFGLEGLSKEKQDNILITITELLLKQIAIVVLEKLNDKDRKQFLEMQKTFSPEEIDNFLITKIENYEELVEKTTREFKDEIKELIYNISK